MPDDDPDPQDCLAAGVAFEAELRRVIEQFRHDWTLTLGTAVGVLECVKHDLMHEDDEDDEERPLRSET